jgi:ATP-dependent DNA helicase RecG
MDQGAPEPRFRVDEEAPVSTLSGVGPKVAERLAALGIQSVRNLAEHVPRDFLDWSEARGFAALRLGQEATVECTVERARLRPTRRRNLKLVEAAVVDGEGGRATAVWFNQAWLAERLVPGTRVLVHGQLQAGGTFKVERHELAGDGAGLHTVGLVPLYPATEAVSTTKLRELTERALPLVRWYADALPAEVRQREKLPLRADALAAYHRPARLEDVRTARERLALE